MTMPYPTHANAETARLNKTETSVTSNEKMILRKLMTSDSQMGELKISSTQIATVWDLLFFLLPCGASGAPAV